MDITDLELMHQYAEEDSPQNLERRQRILESWISAGFLTPFSCCIQWGQAASEDAAVDIESSTSSKEQINRKPRAPLENLLPATRVKELIDQAVETTSTLTRGTSSAKDQQVLRCKAAGCSCLLLHVNT